MVLDAFAAGYKYAVWIDTDAAVMDFDADLRNALPEGALIGAVEHDPARSPYLAKFKVPRHKNVGVLYVKNTPETVKFFENWRDSYPGDDRWFEQGIFNQLSEGNPIVASVDDKWNATINVNMVDKPVVLGWHGIQPAEKRLAMMKKELEHDFLMFRV
jgi:hypothetical protein